MILHYHSLHRRRKKVPGVSLSLPTVDYFMEEELVAEKEKAKEDKMATT